MFARFPLLKVAAIGALALATACAESPSEITSPELELPGGPGLNISPITIGGAFFGFTADNVGSEFWDNLSTDGDNCNIGFFAVGTAFGPCINEKAGTSANAGGFIGGTFFGKNGGAENESFLLPPGSYVATFLGGLRGAGDDCCGPENTIGYYTETGGVKTFIPFASIAANGTLNITTTTNWGLYIKPGTASNFGLPCDDDAGAGLYCTGEGTNLWAMFRSANQLKYLFGVEDRPNSGDYDHNDHFIALELLEPVITGIGRMTGGVTVDHALYRNLKASLTIHCDNRLSNNIQINWNNGQNFHLDKNSLTDVVCQKIGEPRPPVAPINVFSGNATGTLNNQSGARLTFTFTDNGEPGNNDRISLKVYSPSNELVLDVTDAQVKTGNLQAHFDQPHGQKN